MKIPNLILSIVFMCFVGFIHAQMVSTLAGTTTPGFYNGTGTAARFTDPTHVAIDGIGNLYVTDMNNSMIRKIVISTGAVTTLAGSTAYGFANGTGTAARFWGPIDLVCDGNDNLYVVDGVNNQIRKIVISTAVVTTFAGSTTAGSIDGTGVGARFKNPAGIAYDGSDNLYISDAGNNRIRKIVISTGVVTTLAGSTTAGSIDGTGSAARFSNPSGIGYDGVGNLYVADYGNHKIRKVVLSTGVVTTIAGSTTAGFNNGIGVAARFNLPCDVESDLNGNLYVADGYNNQIRKIVISTGEVTTFAGSITAGAVDGVALSARFNFPTGLIWDGNGNLYVSDETNNQIRKITLPVGIDEYSILPAEFSIYPNPFTSQTTITFNEEQKKSVIIIMDVLGKMMKTINFTGKELIIDKEEMKAGIYFVQVTDENKNVFNKKIVIE